MALSSQGGLDFSQGRIQNPTQAVSSSLNEFGSLFKQFQDNKLKAEAVEEAKKQQAIENARADAMLKMREEEAARQREQFDITKNTLRATTEGATLMDKAAVGGAMLDKQAAAISGSNNKGEFTNPLLQRAQAISAKYQPVTNADGTSSAVAMDAKDSAEFESIQKQLGAQAQSVLDRNAKDMNVQKQLISEVGNQYFKEGQDAPMMYDPSSLNKYKQDLLQGLDTRLDREATRAQADAHFNASHKLALANAARAAAHMKKMEKAAEDEKKRTASVGKAMFEAYMPKLVKTPGKYIDDPKASKELAKYDKGFASAQEEAASMFHKMYGDISITKKEIKDAKTGKVTGIQYQFDPIRKGVGSILQTNPAAVRDQFERTAKEIHAFRSDPKNKGKQYSTMLSYGPGATLESNRQSLISSILSPSVSPRDKILKDVQASKFGTTPKVFVPGTELYVSPKNPKEMIDAYGKNIQEKLLKGVPVSDAEYESYVILKNKYDDYQQQQSIANQKAEDEYDIAVMKNKLDQ